MLELETIEVANQAAVRRTRDERPAASLTCSPSVLSELLARS